MDEDDGDLALPSRLPAEELIVLVEPPEATETPGENASTKGRRGRKSTIERDKAWLEEFEASEYSEEAAFAQSKGKKKSMMSRALKRAREARGKLK